MKQEDLIQQVWDKHLSVEIGVHQFDDEMMARRDFDLAAYELLGWLDVDESLPDHGEQVIVWSVMRERAISCTYDSINNWFTNGEYVGAADGDVEKYIPFTHFKNPHIL